jgi:Fructose-2,6-bisphosphatase
VFLILVLLPPCFFLLLLPFCFAPKSDFTRARETATLFASTLLHASIPLYQPPPPQQQQQEEQQQPSNHPSGFQLDIRLRERYFGDWNGKSDVHYQDVWDFDCQDANHQEYNCESVNSVVNRTTDLILDIEQELQKQHPPQTYQVILVAHGDVLQILQTAFLKVDGRVHRSLDHLETATVRELVLKNDE